jgi:uncharacterized repeat protein (TIGR03847 family)
MAEFKYDFDTVHHITAGAIGAPGQRIFYVQARYGPDTLTLIAEKEQIRAMANAIDRLLDELAEKDPRTSTTDDILITDMNLQQPLQTNLRITQMGLGYDADRDMIVLVIQSAIQESDNALDSGFDTDLDTETSDTILARLAATRPQMRALSTHATRVVEAGRPICGNCGRPIDKDGHFCPERN